MTYESRQNTAASDAAKILSNLKERVARLEEDGRGAEGEVQLFRTTTDTVSITDTVTVTEHDAGGFIFNQSSWGFDEFGTNGSVSSPETTSYGSDSYGSDSYGAE